MHKHNNPAETAVVVYGLDQQRGQGGAEETNSLALTGPLAGDRAETCLVSASGYGAEELCVSYLRPHC